jgi:hypothetical protein
MMPLFCWRELGAVGRSRALAVSVAVHVSVLSAFLLLWGGGMPVLPGANVYEQLLLVQRALLAVLLPWTAVRCAAAARGNQLVMLAAATATPPSRVLLGQCAGRCAALAAVVIVGLPPAIVAQQASALPIARIASDALPLLGLCAAASLVASWSMIACRSRVAAWVGASGFVVLITVAASGAGPAAWWMCAALLGVGVAVLAAAADSRFQYLSDEVISA